MTTSLARRLRRTVPPVVGAAVLGGVGTRPTSSWYRSLSTPSWEPPGAVFGPVWSSLYTAIAVASASVLGRLEESGDEEARRAYERALWLNLGLNAGWCWLFFTAERPRLALAEIAVLEASTLDLVRRARAAGDDRAAAALLPYAAWTAFAAALNTSIARRNP